MPSNKRPDSGWRGTPVNAEGKYGILVLGEAETRGDALEKAVDEARSAMLRGVPIKVMLRGVDWFQRRNCAAHRHAALRDGCATAN